MGVIAFARDAFEIVNLFCVVDVVTPETVVFFGNLDLIDPSFFGRHVDRLVKVGGARVEGEHCPVGVIAGLKVFSDPSNRSVNCFF